MGRLSRRCPWRRCCRCRWVGGRGCRCRRCGRRRRRQSGPGRGGGRRRRGERTGEGRGCLLTARTGGNRGRAGVEKNRRGVPTVRNRRLGHDVGRRSRGTSCEPVDTDGHRKSQAACQGEDDQTRDDPTYENAIAQREAGSSGLGLRETVGDVARQLVGIEPFWTAQMDICSFSPAAARQPGS